MNLSCFAIASALLAGAIVPPVGAEQNAAPIRQTTSLTIASIILSDGSAGKASSAFTSEHLGTGQYQITFTPKQRHIMICLVTPMAYQVPHTFLRGELVNKQRCKFEFEDSNGQLTDTFFWFIATPIAPK